MIQAIPALSGSYALHLVVSADCSLVVGRLGVIDFPRGDYLYLGSAQGSGGLRGRLAHHLRDASKLHWHVDWLRQAAMLCCVWYSAGDARLECSWSQALLALPGALAVAPGFGASDCTNGCGAHLVRLPAMFDPEHLENILDGASHGVVGAVS
jgi:Uri superfamily endonuclease